MCGLGGEGYCIRLFLDRMVYGITYIVSRVIVIIIRLNTCKQN